MLCVVGAHIHASSQICRSAVLCVDFIFRHMKYLFFCAILRSAAHMNGRREIYEKKKMLQHSTKRPARGYYAWTDKHTESCKHTRVSRLPFFSCLFSFPRWAPKECWMLSNPRRWRVQQRRQFSIREIFPWSSLQCVNMQNAKMQPKKLWRIPFTLSRAAAAMLVYLRSKFLWKFFENLDIFLIFLEIYIISLRALFSAARSQRVSEWEWKWGGKKKKSLTVAQPRVDHLFIYNYSPSPYKHTPHVCELPSRSRESFNFIWSIYHLAKHTKSREKNGSIMTMMIAFFRVSFRKIPQSTRHCSALSPIVYVE